MFLEEKKKFDDGGGLNMSKEKKNSMGAFDGKSGFRF